MIILKILLWILLSVLLVIIFVLFCNFKMQFIYNGDFKIKIGFLCFYYTLNKPQNENKKKSENVKKKKTREDTEKTHKKTAIDKFTESIKNNGLSELSSSIGKYISPIINELAVVGARVKIKPLKIKFIMAGDDAADLAIHYGQFCSFFYTALGLLDSKLKYVDKSNILVAVNYIGERSEFELFATVKFKSVFVLKSFLSVLVKCGFLNNNKVRKVVLK